ncbi:hypothetical protein [Methylocapsa sp. S129]|uniref:hypothetical protein n=1 Tax=Methylocapsa sp. S129 TaxID=1641869 RepID=UPI00131CF22C|nr:hypothetical protein [Methylocapsa sp. S129]
MPESPKEELARRLAIYPEGALPFFDSGFAVAALLTNEIRKLVLAEVIDNLKRGSRNLSGSALRGITKLSERDNEQLASVYSVIIGLLSESSATPDDFVAAAKGILFTPPHEDIAKSIADSICSAQSEIADMVGRAQLAGEVLPSLAAFDIVVDVRIRVIDGEIKTSIPVAILHVDTDAADQELWVQLSRGDIEETIRKLSKCVADMQLAETLVLRKV